MKILMVVGNYFPEACGGTQVFTQQLAEGILSNGHDVKVLCTGADDKYEEINNVGVYRMKVVNLSVFEENILTKICNKCLHMYNPFNKKKIRAILEKEKPDVVHLQMARTISPVILEVAHSMGIKTVQTLHELYSLWNFNPFIQKNIEHILETKPPLITKAYKRIHKNISNEVDLVTAPSKFAMEQYLKEGYFKESKKKVIKNSMKFEVKDLDGYSLYRKEKLEKEDKIKFLYIGRLAHYKGIEILLETFSEIENDNIELYIAGEGILENLILEYQQKDQRIHYCGFVYDEDKKNLFLQCDVLVFPSTYYETFGLVILEAYIYGLAVIASDIGGVSEVVDNKNTGILIEPNNKESLKKAIEYYTNKEKIIQSIGKSKEELPKYLFKNFIYEYESCYKEVMKE